MSSLPKQVLEVYETASGSGTEHRTSEARTPDGQESIEGSSGDSINATMSAAGMNFRKLIRWLADFFAFILSGHIRGFACGNPLPPTSTILCPQE